MKTLELTCPRWKIREKCSQDSGSGFIDDLEHIKTGDGPSIFPVVEDSVGDGASIGGLKETFSGD
jgi:hypothetical protein